MKNILEMYAKAFGQLINLDKSEVFFTRIITIEHKHLFAQILEVRISTGTGKYLGLPSLIGKSKKSIFSFIKDRMWKKINSQSSKNIFGLGRRL